MDRTMQEYFCPHISKAKASATPLIQGVILAWGYLSFICAARIMDSTEPDELSWNLKFLLMNFALFRINELVVPLTHAVTSFQKGGEDLQDILGATGVLRIKLMDMHSGLKDGSLTPFWVSYNFLISSIITNADLG